MCANVYMYVLPLCIHIHIMYMYYEYTYTGMYIYYEYMFIQTILTSIIYTYHCWDKELKFQTFVHSHACS